MKTWSGMNFYARYRKENANRSRKIKKGIVQLLPFVCLLGIGAAIYFPLSIQLNEKERHAAELRTYLENPENEDAYLKSTFYKEQNNLLGQTVQADEYARKAIESYPRATSVVTDEIEELGKKNQVGLYFTDYSAQTGILQFTANSSDVTNVNLFIKDLLASTLFATVDYSGYSMEEKEAGYLVDVRCMLSESAGK